jgi:hypothetical protein
MSISTSSFLASIAGSLSSAASAACSTKAGCLAIAEGRSVIGEFVVVVVVVVVDGDVASGVVVVVDLRVLATVDDGIVDVVNFDVDWSMQLSMSLLLLFVVVVVVVVFGAAVDVVGCVTSGFFFNLAASLAANSFLC